MKAVLSKAPGGPESLALTDIPTPEPGPGQIRIETRAIGVNYPDRLIIEDRYQVRPDRPFAPCGECAGVVDAIGDGVETFSVGERVMTLCIYGGLAEKLVVDANLVAPLPDHVDFVTGAILPMVYGTALYALVDRGALQAGESLLVLGAAGGVGLAAVELGKALGARVIAATSSEEKLAAARNAGADDGFVYPIALDREGQKALAGRFKEVVGQSGVDIILDPVGGAYSEPALRAMAWGGRFLVVGFPSGLPSIPLNLPLLKSCDLRGVFWGAALQRDPNLFRNVMVELTSLLAKGKLSPRIDAQYPLDRAAEALAQLDKRRIVGKLVVVL